MSLLFSFLHTPSVRLGISVHFFDWDGNYRYRIIVREDLFGLTFDPIDSCLYSIDRANGKILRYNLSSILSPESKGPETLTGKCT